jgi:spermidine synthase
MSLLIYENFRSTSRHVEIITGGNQLIFQGLIFSHNAKIGRKGRKSTGSLMRPPFFSIALLSASALSYEILLIRLFSIIQWHHFAYMIISLSLLGYGASGMFLSLARDWLRPRFAVAFMANGLLFSFSSIICFLVGQQIPFNPLEMAWGTHQIIYLLLLYLLLALPFFAVANCIGLTFSQFTDDIPRIYGFDLLGAGAGALSIIILLFLIAPGPALYVIGSLGLLATAVGFLESRLRPRWIAALLIAVAMSLIPILHQQKISLQVSPYKSLSQTLTVMGTEVIKEHSSPLGLLTVVKSPVIPFRHAPGLSLNSSFEPPPQLGVFTDGEGMSVITNDDGQHDSFAYMDFFTSALPYHLLSHPRVLILGAGGGADILQARYFGAKSIDAVEINPQMADLVINTYADFAGNLYADKNVHIHIAEARGFVSASNTQYDLIHVALLDAFSASSAGLYSLSESYTYTTEALSEYIQHLSPDGIVAITRWIKLPPRDGLKLFATAAAALERIEVKEPGHQLILIRSWKTSTLLIKNGIFTGQDIKVLREFCEARSFDLGYYPGMVAAEANHHNILDRPYFFEGTTALLNKAEGKDFLNRYKFNIEPATDDRPYFSHFFKWSTLPELLSLRASGGLPLLEQGYLVLIATFVQAVLASVLLILVPLWSCYRRATKTSSTFIRHEQVWVVIYFFSLGIAFLFIEMAFIQKFILFLRHPLYAVGVVISGFLLFAGLGSNYSSLLKELTASQRNILILPVTAIAGIALLYLYLLPVLFRHLLWLPDPLKVFVSLCLIAPLAFCMGMPFPLGLHFLSIRAPELIPLAWGINGCASVISAVLATILAIHIGFRGIVVAAVCLYVLAAIVYPNRKKILLPSPKS